MTRSFQDAVEHGQNEDGMFVGPYARRNDLPPGVRDADGEPKPKHRVLPYTHHIDVFVIHRPWETCPRCKKQRAAGRDDAEDTPDDELDDVPEDFVCPHTRRDAYLELMKHFMKDGWRCIDRRAETLKNGVIQISVEWWVPDQTEAPAPKALGRL